jgi:hypothetical protein
MATRTISALGGNYNLTTTWVEGAVPTANDDVIATALSGNLNITANAVAKSVDLTGYVGGLAHGSFSWTIGNFSGGNFKIPASVGYTTTSNASCRVILKGGTTVVQVDCAVTLQNLTLTAVSNSYELVRGLTVVDRVNHVSGVFYLNTHSLTCTSYEIYSDSLELNGTPFNVVNLYVDGGSINAGVSSVVFTGSGSCQLQGSVLWNVFLNGTDIIFYDTFEAYNNKCAYRLNSCYWWSYISS